MRYALLTLFMLSASVMTQAQTETLSEKSQEITTATYWEQDNAGRWVSRKNTKRPVRSEGVHVDNFTSLFIGTYQGTRYLFCDAFDYKWRYPNLKIEWIYSRQMYALLLSDSDYARLRDLRQGETINVLSSYHNEIFKGDDDYSFGFFLRLTETLRASGDSSPRYAIAAKRTERDGKDVVRFLTAPHCLPDLLDFNYFEVSYSDFQRLFTPDTKLTYK